MTSWLGYYIYCKQNYAKYHIKFVYKVCFRLQFPVFLKMFQVNRFLPFFSRSSRVAPADAFEYNGSPKSGKHSFHLYFLLFFILWVYRHFSSSILLVIVVWKASCPVSTYNFVPCPPKPTSSAGTWTLSRRDRERDKFMGHYLMGLKITESKQEFKEYHGIWSGLKYMLVSW